MDSSAILEIVIGLAFVYLLLSLIASIVNEWFAAFLSRRAGHLYKSLQALLRSGGNGVTVDKFLEHPLVRSLKHGQGRPSYIPSRIFALTVLDLICPAKAASPSVAELREEIEKSPELRSTILPLISAAGDDLQHVQAAIEQWFNDAMERATGIYKRWNMLWMACIAFTLSVILNADTLDMAKTLWSTPALRQAVTTAAVNYLDRHETHDVGAEQRPTTAKAEPDGNPVTNLNPFSAETTDEEMSQRVQILTNELRGLKLTRSIASAWADQKKLDGGACADWWLWKLTGLLLTTAAVSLGAPFWFDTLNRVAQIRSSVKPKRNGRTRAS